MPKRYEENRLYCTKCKVQPESFLEIVHRQLNVVTPDGKQIDTTMVIWSTGVRCARRRHLGVRNSIPNSLNDPNSTSQPNRKEPP